MNEKLLELAKEAGFVGYGEESKNYTIPIRAFEGRIIRFAELVQANTVPDGYVHNIEVEKLLCEKLGKAWSPNCSIVSLINELASKPPIVDNGAEAKWISVEHSLPDKKCFAFYKDELGNSRTVCANYIKKYTQEAGMDDEWIEYCDDDDTYYYPEGWYKLIDNWDDYSFITINHQVTHWLPLPNPPTVLKNAPKPPIVGDDIFVLSDGTKVTKADDKLKVAIEALQHIAIKQAKDGQAKYAIAKQALEKIGEV